jgi:hypothetical protein
MPSSNDRRAIEFLNKYLEGAQLAEDIDAKIRLLRKQHDCAKSTMAYAIEQLREMGQLELAESLYELAITRHRLSA